MELVGHELVCRWCETRFWVCGSCYRQQRYCKDGCRIEVFFQVISARHDQELGTIATTNIPFGKFNQIFANDAIAHAIVDRLVNDAEIFFMEGVSYREQQKEQKQKRRTK